MDKLAKQQSAIRLAETLGEDNVEAPEPEEELPIPATIAARPEDLSIDDLQRLLEQKRLDVAKEAESDGKKVTPPTKAPAGMLWVFNRTSDQFFWQYDSLIYEIEGHDMMLFPERIARHGRKRSLLSLDLVANTAIFRLVLEDEPKFGVPLRIVNRLELIDRTHGDNPIGAATYGKTHIRTLKVDGAAEMLRRRAGQYVELE